MKNILDHINRQIDTLRKQLSVNKGTLEVEPLVDNLLNNLLDNVDSTKLFWSAIKQSQTMIENETGEKYAMREAFLRWNSKNGGDKNKMLAHLYYHLPTEEEELKKKQKREAYYTLGAKHIGQIIDIKPEKFEHSTCVSGISRSESHKYSESNGYHGSNGTYRIGYPEIHLSLLLVIKLRNHPHVRIDIRSKALEINNRQKVTEAFISALKDKLLNQSIEIEFLGKDLDENFGIVDFSILKI